MLCHRIATASHPLIDWELILNPSINEPLPVGDASNPVTYALISRTQPYAQPIQMVSTILDLGLSLNTGVNANDCVPHATNKAGGMFFFT